MTSTEQRNVAPAGRGWFHFTPGARVTSVVGLIVGKVYLMETIRNQAIRRDAIWISGKSDPICHDGRFWTYFDPTIEFRKAGATDGCRGAVYAPFFKFDEEKQTMRFFEVAE